MPYGRYAKGVKKSSGAKKSYLSGWKATKKSKKSKKR